MNKTFYLTTAIAYASRKPHIGNAYDIVLADAIARFKRMEGYDVHFLTGSDEHGQKIEEYARQAGVTPKEYVDGVADQIKSVWQSMNVTYDRFIRTTDPDHEASVKAPLLNVGKKKKEEKVIFLWKICVLLMKIMFIVQKI